MGISTDSDFFATEPLVEAGAMPPSHHRISRRVATTARKWLFPVIVLGLVWEGIAKFAGLSPKLFPTIETVGNTFWSLLRDGTLLDNTWPTLSRLFFGWAVAAVIGILVGFAMSTLPVVRDFFLPLISILMPIPALAWIPLFILWFGLGNTSVVILVIFASSLPITLNTWTGMRSINPILIRAARSMDVSRVGLFKKVILPGSLPVLMTGLRIGIAQAWRAVVAGEMIAGSANGLGVLIFNSSTFLQTDVMLATLLVIGPLGFIFEKVLFQSVEHFTIERWGMSDNG